MHGRVMSFCSIKEDVLNLNVPNNMCKDTSLIEKGCLNIRREPEGSKGGFSSHAGFECQLACSGCEEVWVCSV